MLKDKDNCFYKTLKIRNGRSQNFRFLHKSPSNRGVGEYLATLIKMQQKRKVKNPVTQQPRKSEVK